MTFKPLKIDGFGGTLSGGIYGNRDSLNAYSDTHLTIDGAVNLLSEIKASLEHGQWIPWIEENLPFGRMQAAKYMRVFEHKAELNETSKFHLTEAVKLLSTPKPKKEPVKVEAANYMRVFVNKDVLSNVTSTLHLEEAIKLLSEPKYSRGIQGGFGAARLYDPENILLKCT